MPTIYRLFVVCILSISMEVSAASFFAFETSTPEGSWVVSEVTTTDHKGKQTVMITRQKFLGSEQRDDQTYYWLETEMDSFKVKKGERKANGDHVVMKVLVSQEAMNSDPANVINNMQGFGKEIIMQNGDSQPMRISDGGMLAGSMMKSMGIEVNYQFEEEGTETVETNAGQFTAKRVAGSGSTTSKVLFKKMEIQSNSVMWISDEVPFGVVKSESTDLVNGKEQNSQTVLIEFGLSGATTAITGDVMEMPF